ncbi:hypothetical protein CAOG_009347 [Capsaspora owczarzaki ATCC 30864]|uniref:Uncharacterized protein n=1 Tax=Capsaspora owczarzaki (strain ATCC 30864) TaxID=595528 RepID=A0A0D2WJ90_CAPO3|nr:hypothetical protein CAOG_009347 [Capsaspora owczarzaki ATCC 30864]
MDSSTRKNTDLSAILDQKDLSCDELRGIERSIAALAACLGVTKTVFAPFSKSLVSNVPDASRCAALLEVLTGQVAGKAKPTDEEKLVVKLLFENLGLHSTAKWTCKATGQLLLDVLIHDLQSKQTVEDAANQVAEINAQVAHATNQAADAIAQAKMRIAEAANQVAAAHAQVATATNQVEAANARVKELWAKNRTLEARKLELEAKGNVPRRYDRHTSSAKPSKLHSRVLLLTDASLIMDSTTRKNTDLSAILDQTDLSCGADELRGIERSIAALAACLGVAKTVFVPFSKSLVSNVPDASRCAALLKALTGQVAGKAKPTGEEKLVVKLLFENLGLHSTAKWTCNVTGQLLLDVLVHDLQSKQTVEDAANQVAEANAQVAKAANQVAEINAQAQMQIATATNQVEAANARVKELWAKNRTLEARKLELEAKGNANPATFPLYGVNLTAKWLLTRPELQEKIVNAGDRVLVTAPPIHALPQNLELCY